MTNKEKMKDEYSVCAALLHDVAEDTAVTIEQLSVDFPVPVIEALKLLTNDEATDYYTYIRRLKHDDIAKAVKLADLEHNSDMSRAAFTNESDEKKKARLEKYTEAKRILIEE